MSADIPTPNVFNVIAIKGTLSREEKITLSQMDSYLLNNTKVELRIVLL